MRILTLLWMVGIVLCGEAGTGTRLSAYGSNPLLSVELFPQDIGVLHSNFLLYQPSYEKKPYWGDIDQPGNKPNGTYTSTGIDVADDNARFFHTAKIYSVTNTWGYAHSFISGLTARANLDYDVDTRYNHAEGTLVGDGNSVIPFDYSMAHALNALRLQGMLSFDAFGIPAGVRLVSGFENTLILAQHFDFTQSGTAYSSERATWGWATTPCAHIFNVTGVQGDAWLQDGYVKGPLYTVNLQAGATMPLGKLGLSVAYRTGHQDYYAWTRGSDPGTGNAVLDQNFVGSYQKNNWSGTTHDLDTRLYGNLGLRKGERYALNSFFSLAYENSLQGEALSRNLDISGDAKDKINSFRLEAAPNISIPFDSWFSYIDCAVVSSYEFSRFDNTDMRWVGGGQLETWVNSSTSAGDETTWEGYSYANRSTMDVGLDLSAMFPLINGPAHRIGLGLQLLIDSRFMFMTKYYGQNIDQGTEVDFRVDNLRRDFEREILFASGVKLQYQRRPFLAWFEITEPLLRSFLPRTRVTDAGGKNLLYEHEKSPLWMSQEGLRVGVYGAYEWTLPWLAGR